jgi:virginiamycin A acetyltransferase
MKTYTLEPEITESIIHSSAHLDKFSKVQNSELKKNTAIYRFAWVKNSIIGENSSLGDFSKVDESIFGPYTRIGRFNHIYQSHFGNHSYTGPNTVIMHAQIGQFNSISWNVSIGGANHDYKRVTGHSFLYNDYDDLRPNEIPIPYNRFDSPCILGNDVWVGSGAVILRNVIIGHGAVIGSNAVVTNNVPPYSVVVGSPARVIKYRFEEDVINRLLEIQWWDLPDETILDNFELFSSYPDDYVLNQLARLKNNGCYRIEKQL